ncbi:MAG: hypothetical protein HYV14_16345 [Elusimicrobia bacterium]|nr:hypothetical protein [Elusimicrobiota bacterium]
MSRSDRILRRLGPLSLVPVALLPLSNPDLFWHLSAARRMRETLSIPTADWLSSTRAGAPWADFEWAVQLIFDALYRAGGLHALWLFKAAMIAASAWLLLKTLELYDAEEPTRAAALALWGAASLTRSDIRPELFSLIGFGLVFLGLERRRLGLPAPGPAWCAALFCLWANLHPGFVYGLVLLGLYGAWRHLGAAALGCLLQVQGPAGLAVIWRHWQDAGNISVRLSEWRAIRLDDPWHWPFWLALLGACGAALLALRARRRPALGPLAAVLFFGFAASRHSRMAAYSVACSVPLIAAFLKDAGVAASPSRRRLAWALAAGLGAFSLYCALLYGFGRTPFNDHFVPRRAAEFLASQAGDLPRRALYNPWGWGGYLGWRLHPDYLVFQDGRYLFHDLLVETGDALASPADWQAFLDRRGIDLALMENLPLIDAATMLPYHAAYMPRERWALVYADGQALLFARRASVPRPWLAARELR